MACADLASRRSTRDKAAARIRSGPRRGRPSPSHDLAGQHPLTLLVLVPSYAHTPEPGTTILARSVSEATPTAPNSRTIASSVSRIPAPDHAPDDPGSPQGRPKWAQRGPVWTLFVNAPPPENRGFQLVSQLVCHAGRWPIQKMCPTAHPSPRTNERPPLCLRPCEGGGGRSTIRRDLLEWCPLA